SSSTIDLKCFTQKLVAKFRAIIVPVVGLKNNKKRNASDSVYV
ncbi:10532_t:CDS:2, partial [Funneliformis caledonium]